VTPRPSSSGAGAARAAARAILHEARFREPPVPRPLAGVLRWIGHALDYVFAGAHGGTLASIDLGYPVLFVALVVLVVAVAFAIARIGVRGRVHDARTIAARHGASTPVDALAREADAAELAGEFDRAVRLRFEAGLAALAERGTIPQPTALRAAQIRMRLRSPLFDRLNVEFERVAYGGRHANPAAAGNARESWRRLLEEDGR